MSKYWCLKTTFYKGNKWITEYSEMRNKFPLSREEFDVMAKDQLDKYDKEGKMFCYTISRARKPKGDN